MNSLRLEKDERIEDNIIQDVRNLLGIKRK